MPRAATVRSKMPAERSLAASARLRVKRDSRRRCQWAMRSPVLASYSFSAARKTASCAWCRCNVVAFGAAGNGAYAMEIDDLGAIADPLDRRCERRRGWVIAVAEGEVRGLLVEGRCEGDDM